MFATREIYTPTAPSVRSQSRFGTAAALILLLALAAVFVGIATAPRHGSSGRAQVYPASLSLHIASPSFSHGSADADYAQPAGVAELGGLLYVLDTGNNRILAQNTAGTVRQVIDGSRDGEPTLRGAMSIATDGRYLYVANTGSSQIVVLEPNGQVVRTVDLASEAPAGRPPRPVGLAVRPDGALLVSDADGNRVLYYNAEGRLQWALGDGARASGSEGFNSPGGVAVDVAGYTYVVDILNSRVVKLSPDGALVRQFGRPGDTAGTFSRPKDVAIDAAGTVYVSDGLLAAVQVFSANGDYLGFIGRADPGDPHSQSLFTAPAGLAVANGKLWVVDRFGGLFAFQLPR